MKLTYALVAIYCGVLFIAACNKNKNDNKDKTVARQLLENGKWQLSASTATVTHTGLNFTTDLYGQVNECDKDDFILFAENGTAYNDEGANKCPDDQQIETAHWALLNNDTKLALVDSNPDTMDVEITNLQMKLTQTKPNSSGEQVTYIHTYTNIK